MTETVFYVPRLNAASVAAGACCPVPAEAILLPELELVPGVDHADANWQMSEIKVRHAPDVDPKDLAALLDELSYPPTSWHTRDEPATGDETGQSPLRRKAACQENRNTNEPRRSCS